MRSRSPSTWAVLKLLGRTAVLQLLRSMQIQKQRKLGRDGLKKSAKRGGTKSKHGNPLAWLMVLMFPVILFQLLTVSAQAVRGLQVAAAIAAPDGKVLPLTRDMRSLRWGNFERAALDGDSEEAFIEELDSLGVTEEHRPSRSQLIDHFRVRGRGGLKWLRTSPLAEPRSWLTEDARRIVVRGGSLLLFMLLGIVLFMGVAGKNANLAGNRWTDAWMLTFPVRTKSYVLAKVLAYSLVQLAPWLTIFPLTFQLLLALEPLGANEHGSTFVWNVLIAIAATLVSAFLVGAFRLVIETLLRLKLSLHQMKKAQGALTLLGMSLMAIVMSVALLPLTPQWFVTASGWLPQWMVFFPAAWPIAMAEHGVFVAISGLSFSLISVVFACSICERLLAHGAMVSGGVDAGQRGVKAGQWKRVRRLGVVGKDLALLFRDRNFLIQTLIVPILIVAMQLLINPGLDKVSGVGLPLMAYGVGLYSVIGGCFQVLSGEGKALWMLFSLPVSIAEVLRRKTRIWASVAVAYSVVALLFLGLQGTDSDPVVLVGNILFVGLGVWCAAHVAAAISVIGCKPNADVVSSQPKARFIYLYFFLASIYLLALMQESMLARLSGLSVFATISYAVWQRSCDRLPWLLDPVDEMAPSISLLDGAVSLVVFFILQSLLSVILIGGVVSADDVPLAELTIAFAVSGAVAVLLAIGWMRSRGVSIISELCLKPRSWRHAISASWISIVIGAAVGLVGVGYAKLNDAMGWFDVPEVLLAAESRWDLILLVCVFAPLVEEVVFRGLIFGGLRRAVGPTLAVIWSSALFALVHPTIAWLPVFVMGVAAAVVYRHMRFLPAAMLVHATYNCVVTVL
jgi:ABC-2 type transport system permease protein